MTVEVISADPLTQTTGLLRAIETVGWFCTMINTLLDTGSLHPFAASVTNTL